MGGFSDLAASVFPSRQPSLFLFPLDRYIHDIALAVHEEEGKIGGFEGIDKALMIHLPIPRDSLIVKKLRPR